MSHLEQPSAFEQSIQSQLDQSVRDLDRETLQRLQAARRMALQVPNANAGLSRWSAWFSRPTWLTPSALASGLVMCSVFAVAIGLTRHHANPDVPVTLAHLEMTDFADDDEVLTDPGFYLWLEETQPLAGLDDDVEPAV